jgi:hypothetical protein
VTYLECARGLVASSRCANISIRFARWDGFLFSRGDTSAGGEVLLYRLERDTDGEFDTGIVRLTSGCRVPDFKLNWENAARTPVPDVRQRANEVEAERPTAR